MPRSSEFFKDDLLSEYIEKSRRSQGPFRYLDDKIYLSQVDRPETLFLRSTNNSDVTVTSSGASSTCEFNIKTNAFLTNAMPGCESHLVYDCSNSNVATISSTVTGIGIIHEPYAILQQVQHNINGTNLTRAFQHPWRFACNEVLDLPLNKNVMNGYKYGAQVQYNLAEPIMAAQASTQTPVTSLGSAVPILTPAYIGAPTVASGVVTSPTVVTFYLPFSIIMSLILADTNSLLPDVLLGEHKLTLWFRNSTQVMWPVGVAAANTAVSQQLTYRNIRLLVYTTFVSEDVYKDYKDLYNAGRLVMNTFERSSISQGCSIFPNTTAQEISLYPGSKYVQTLEFVLESSVINSMVGNAYKSLTTCNPNIIQYRILVNSEATTQDYINVDSSLEAYIKCQDCRYTRFKSQFRGEDLVGSTLTPVIFSNYRTARQPGYPCAYTDRTDAGRTFSSALRMCENLSSVDALPWSGKKVNQVSLVLTTGSGSFYQYNSTNGTNGAPNVADTALTAFSLICLMYCRSQVVFSPSAGSMKILPFMSA